MTDLDGITIPDSSSNLTPIPEDTSERLGSCVRQIGDFDYVNLGGEDFSATDKDGRVLYFDAMPEDIKPAIKEHTRKKNRTLLDGTASRGRSNHRVSRIYLNDNEVYYVERPDAQLGGKVLYTLSNGDITPENIAGTDYNIRLLENVNFDFTHMLDAFSTMYTREQLVQTAYQMILESEHAARQDEIKDGRRYTGTAADNFANVLNNPQFDPIIKSFLEEIKQLDTKGEKILDKVQE